MEFNILFEDDALLVVDKPAGFHVHRPENRRIKVAKEKTCIHWLRARYGEGLRPAHRLDAATSGCLIWAKTKEAANCLGKQFAESAVEKSYQALVRGWMSADWRIDLDLSLDSTGELVPAITEGVTLAYYSLPVPVGKRHSTARYSLLQVHPRTGRYRQIRRHLRKVSHPIIGDSDQGDPYHNRFFNEHFATDQMFLRANEIRFRHPSTGAILRIGAPQAAAWLNLLNQLSPFECSSPEEVELVPG